uniref:Uncharacterized protein n=1 Tax=Marseillevirus LCMAC103 TaxID=2506604 RepID=A0A481YWW4_9VIRU|nr:MAG: hypothetical protein LCMAC103_03600 [Marseillevirus LCMAC103]
MVLDWDPAARLVSASAKDNNAWFTPASIAHFFSGFVAQALLQKLPVDPLLVLVAANVIHAMEDVMENTNTFSLEHLFAKLAGCMHPAFLGSTDHDSLQNHLGDVFSFFVGSVLAYSYRKALSPPEYTPWIFAFAVFALAGYTAACHAANGRKQGEP